MKIKYDIIYSIGYDCSCALCMKEAGLRLTSGPFDWLTRASFEERMKLISGGFTDFMNQADFKLLPIGTTEKIPHLKYENMRTGFHFYHDFPTDGSFEEVFPMVAEKYQRRINRFYNNLKEKKKVLLIFMSQYTKTSDEVVQSLCTKVCQKIGRKIDFLIIEHQEGQQIPVKRTISDNITRYDLHITVLDSQQIPTLFGNKKACLKIFKNYTIPLKDRLQKIISRTLSKLITPFIWNKSLKKRIKHRLTA